MQHDRSIADHAQIVERVAVEPSHRVYRDLSHDRLVERLDRHDYVLHIWLGVSLVEDAQRLMRVRDAVCVTPLWIRLLPSAVVEAVLALRRTVQVDDDFEPPRQVSKQAAARPKKNKPMGKSEQEDNMRKIQEKLQSFQGGASGSSQSPPGESSVRARFNHQLTSSVHDASSDDDDSGSESEEE